MFDKQAKYLSYLLRLWRDDGDGTATWRASLQDSIAEDQRSLSCLDELFRFLRKETGIDSDEQECEGTTGINHDAYLRPPPEP